METSHSDRVDQASRGWRQGDYVLGECWFVRRFNPDLPLTAAAADAASSGTDLVEDSFGGMVITSQTCDIVRPALNRPYIDVSPLVKVSDEDLHDIRKAMLPRFAFIPALADLRLVADLDQTMTVEKGFLSLFAPEAGCRNDAERRELAKVLARKRARAAFPDDFQKIISKLRSRVLKKINRDSAEGRALQALREIRVRAAPSWDAADVQLVFYFIVDDESEVDDRPSQDQILSWLKLVDRSGRFAIEGHVTKLDDMRASEYTESDMLDLEHLSLEQVDADDAGGAD